MSPLLREGGLAGRRAPTYLLLGTRKGLKEMLGILAFFGGLFALVWTAVIASVGVVLLFALLVPLLILALFFRIGFFFLKFAAALVLLCFVAAALF